MPRTWDETYWGVNVREGANAYWVTLIFDVELLVTGAVRCDGVEVSVEVPLRQTDVKMDFALQVPLDYVSLSDEVVALTAKRLRLDGSGAIRPRLSAAKREMSSGDPFLLKGNTNKSNEVRRWWAAHRRSASRWRSSARCCDAPRLCAERLPMDKAEGGVEAMDNETWAQEAPSSTTASARVRVVRAPAPRRLTTTARRLVVEAPRRLAALRHRRRRSSRRRLAAHLARGAAPPLRRPLRRRRAGGGGGLAGHAVARRSRRVGRVARRVQRHRVRQLPPAPTRCAGSPSACAGMPTTTRRAASRRGAPTSDSSSAPPATSSPDRGGVAGPLLPSSELPGWWLEQLDDFPAAP